MVFSVSSGGRAAQEFGRYLIRLLQPRPLCLPGLHMYMIDQLLEDHRRIWESLLTVQRDLVSQWQNAYLSAKPGVTGQVEWDKDLQKRWREFVLATFNKHRELMDSPYNLSSKMLERTWRIADARSPDEFRQAMDEFWSQTFTSFKESSEARVRDFYAMAGAMYDLSRKSAVP